MPTHKTETELQSSESEKSWKLPRQFITSKGSVYTLGDDNRYSRYKTVTGEQDDPTNLTVFMDMPKPYSPYYELKFLDASQNRGWILVVQLDQNGEWDGPVSQQSDIKDPNNLAVVVANRDTHQIEAQVDATLFPEIGKKVFEYSEQDGMKYTHVGHNVTNITE
ncbi:MAG: hypothetical protein ACXWLH_01215 [Candidatus Saccharimonadales bacterium]